MSALASEPPRRAARFASVDALLADARSRLVRVSPHQAAHRTRAGARLVDIRPQWQREADGIVPGALHVDRNHLEWRLHPESGASLAEATWDAEWIVLCTEGYTSSLAAAALRSLGLDATDVVGGIHAWRAAGLPVDTFPIADVGAAVKTVVP
ncbi:MAG: sulfurtransferase [Actinomycetales bacterium]|nr:MAG: sulfurtransferase [Actinomycetales bacterium]